MNEAQSAIGITRVPALTVQGNALLQNPFWHALGTEHAALAQASYLARRYPADVIPFAALASRGHQAFAELHDLLMPGESIYITGEPPQAHPGLLHELTLPGLQMVYAPAGETEASPAAHPGTGLDSGAGTGPASDLGTGAVASPIADTVAIPTASRADDDRAATPGASEPEIDLLGPADLAAMLELKRLAFPGYFGPRAPLLGVFYGIHVNGELVSMAGERLALPGLREVSAVCTHPDHTGRGYSARLIRSVVSYQLRSGVLPFLQVASDNARAIALYRRLGFVAHREILFHRFQRSPNE